MPKYSILMPVLMQYEYQYNMTIAAINNILNFSFNFELIIIHSMANYHGEDIKKLLREEDLYIPYDNNPSQVEVLNRAIKQVKGDYIILIGNDNFVHQDWLKQIEKYLKNKDYHILACCSHRNFMEEPLRYSAFSFVNFQGVTIPRKIFDDIGLFDEKLPFYYWEQDFDKRLDLKGYRVGIVRDSLMTTPQSMTRMNAKLPRGIKNWWTEKAMKKEIAYFKEKWNEV